MARGLIGKAVRGANEGFQKALPYIMEEKLEARRNAALEQRDARLNAYETARQQSQNEFTRSENIAGRALESERNEISRSQLGVQEAQLEILRTGHALDARRVEALIDQIEQEIDISRLAAQDVQAIREIRSEALAATESGDADAQARAIERLRIMTQGAPTYQGVTAYGDENDLGVQSRVSGILNQATGGVSWLTPPNQRPTYQTPEEVRAAMRAGKITRDEARVLLLDF